MYYDGREEKSGIERKCLSIYRSVDGVVEDVSWYLDCVLFNLPWFDFFSLLYIAARHWKTLKILERTTETGRQGRNCCSPHVISFHHVKPKMMYTIDFLIYSLKLDHHKEREPDHEPSIWCLCYYQANPVVIRPNYSKTEQGENQLELTSTNWKKNYLLMERKICFSCLDHTQKSSGLDTLGRFGPVVAMTWFGSIAYETCNRHVYIKQQSIW